VEYLGISWGETNSLSEKKERNNSHAFNAKKKRKKI
jgi:hypothetical protein